MAWGSRAMHITFLLLLFYHLLIIMQSTTHHDAHHGAPCIVYPDTLVLKANFLFIKVSEANRTDTQIEVMWKCKYIARGCTQNAKQNQVFSV